MKEIKVTWSKEKQDKNKSGKGERKELLSMHLATKSKVPNREHSEWPEVTAHL